MGFKIKFLETLEDGLLEKLSWKDFWGLVKFLELSLILLIVNRRQEPGKCLDLFTIYFLTEMIQNC